MANANGKAATRLPEKISAKANPEANEAMEIAGNIIYHAKYSPHFPPLKFGPVKLFTLRRRVFAIVSFRDRKGWLKMSILSTAGSGKFSSDRTIAQYAKESWNIEACPVP